MVVKDIYDITQVVSGYYYGHLANEHRELQ